MKNEQIIVESKMTNEGRTVYCIYKVAMKEEKKLLECKMDELEAIEYAKNAAATVKKKKDHQPERVFSVEIE